MRNSTSTSFQCGPGNPRRTLKRWFRSIFLASEETSLHILCISSTSWISEILDHSGCTTLFNLAGPTTNKRAWECLVLILNLGRRIKAIVQYLDYQPSMLEWVFINLIVYQPCILLFPGRWAILFIHNCHESLDHWNHDVHKQTARDSATRVLFRRLLSSNITGSGTWIPVVLWAELCHTAEFCRKPAKRPQSSRDVTLLPYLGRNSKNVANYEHAFYCLLTDSMYV